MNVSPVSSLTPMEHARATRLSGAALRTASPAEQTAAVGAKFEAIIVRQLLGPTLTKMLDSSGGAAGGIYGDLLTDTMANQLTSGPGLGLGRMVEQQLAPRGGHAPLPEAPHSLQP